MTHPEGRAILVGRRTAEARSGGDAMQAEESAAVLRSAGWDASVSSDASTVEPRRGDVVHLHNIQRVHDWGDLPERARAAGARVVVSTLYHPVDRYHREGRRGLGAVAAKLVPDADRFAGLRWGRAGLKERAAEVLAGADRVLVVHPGEADRVAQDFGVSLRDVRVVPVAIPNLELPGSPSVPAPFGDGAPFACSVARIEPLKDPLAVLAAAAEAGAPVALVGPTPGARHAGHTARVRAEAKRLGPSRARLLGELSRADVLALLRLARVHVLASWTEVVGRVTLEAAGCGAAVVLTDVGWAPDYLGRDTPGVHLAEPGDGPGLAAAIARAWTEGRPPDADGGAAHRVRTRHTWRAVGPALLEALS